MYKIWDFVRSPYLDVRLGVFRSNTHPYVFNDYEMVGPSKCERSLPDVCLLALSIQLRRGIYISMVPVSTYYLLFLYNLHNRNGWVNHHQNPFRCNPCIALERTYMLKKQLFNFFCINFIVKFSNKTLGAGIKHSFHPIVHFF